MPVDEAVRDYLIKAAMEDHRHLSDDELEKKRVEFEKGLQLVIRPYLFRKEFRKIQDILDEMMKKVDSSIYDKRFAEKVKRTLYRVKNWCRAWERLKS